MSGRPIFVATHPRACSTAFERVFMTRRDTLACVHEPFGDAYYFGPERMATRYEDDEKARRDSGFSDSTFQSVFETIEKENVEGKRIFVKDMALYWMPPDEKPSSIAPSLVSHKRGVGTKPDSPMGTTMPNGEACTPYPYKTEPEPENPTVIPEEMLKKFHFIFLIRHPSSSIPSYYRCTIPPLDKVTGWYNFMPSEAGYAELRQLFDYLRKSGQVGEQLAGNADDTPKAGGNGVEICLVDADDLLDNPSGVIEAVCKSVGIEYSPSMLKWDCEESHQYAKEAFEKWKGFHEDAIHSTELKPRQHKKVQKSDEELYTEWKAKYGEEAADVIRDTVANCLDDYNHLKQFAIKV